MLGPGSGLGHSSITFIIECQVNYIIDCIRKLSDQPDKKTMDLKAHVLKDFVDYLDLHMKNKVFAGSCVSWYKSKRGVNWTLWPKDLVTFWISTYACHENEYNFQ